MVVGIMWLLVLVNIWLINWRVLKLLLVWWDIMWLIWCGVCMLSLEVGLVWLLWVMVERLVEVVWLRVVLELVVW